MRIGIVGHEAAKFTVETELKAKEIIAGLLDNGGDVLVSGRCHLGGIDVWAEEKADFNNMKKLIFPPKQRSWSGGYKARNLEIAQNSDVVHVIVVAEYPPNWRGRRFERCYHCNTNEHVKSGGCWTAKEAQRMGKDAYWHII